jgi:hypothetical protein
MESVDLHATDLEICSACCRTRVCQCKTRYFIKCLDWLSDSCATITNYQEGIFTSPTIIPAYVNATLSRLNHGDVFVSTGSIKAADLAQMTVDTKSIRPSFASEIQLETP